MASGFAAEDGLDVYDPESGDLHVIIETPQGSRNKYKLDLQVGQFRLNKVLRSSAEHLTLEKGFSYPGMLGQLWSMRKLRTTNTTFLTVPVAAKPNAKVAGADVIRLDPAKDEVLWDALRKDRVAEYLAFNSDAAVLQ